MDVQEDEKRAPDIVPGDRGLYDSDHGGTFPWYGPQVSLERIPALASLGCFPALLANGLLPSDPPIGVGILCTTHFRM